MKIFAKIKEKILLPKEKMLELKEKRNAKLVEKYTTAKDIKYRGYFSYRSLRVIAWIAFAFGQLYALYGVFSNEFINWSFLPNAGVQTVVSFVGNLATPLFIVAAFGLVLSGQKKFKAMIVFYAAAYIGMALALIIFYYRYLLGIFHYREVADSVISSFGFVVKLNVFGDLLAFSLFHLFICYHPKKFFTGKKLIYFRLLALLPVAFIVISYILKTFAMFGKNDLPFGVIPFLSTKPPLVLAIFAILSLWFKYRERKFTKLGLTRDDYRKYLKTNRNSLSFSIALSVYIAIFAVAEFIVIISMLSSLGYDWTVYYSYVLSIGETVPLILVIPFIMLYSYTKTHKNGAFDIIVPIAGIGMTVIVYAEVIYQFFVQVVWVG